MNDKLESADGTGLVEKRRWFRSAVQSSARWREEAEEDYRFVSGEQWDDEDRQALNSKGRPTLTVNVTRPLINLVCGYQSSNRFEPDFLPRNDGDEQVCQIVKGVTKWVSDQAEYDTNTDDVFRDCVIGGKGFFWVDWKWDYDVQDGNIAIERQSPFDIYIDPESLKDDLSDARFVVKATWESKDKIAQIYPEFKDEILEMNRQYDSSERIPTMTDSGEPIWYSSDYKKIRVVQMWYRDYIYETKWILPDNTVIEQEQADQIPGFAERASQIGAKKTRVPTNKIKCCTFCEDVVFEDIDSPYKHGMFPLVQQFTYHTNERDVPQGIVRDLKDPQREINKLRSQRMHIVNTMANRIWMAPKGSLDESDKRNLRDNGSTPGTLVEYNAVGQPPQPVDTTSIPAGFVQMEEATKADIRVISGINEELLGSDLTAAASGRAIELRQKQAMTQLAVLFDNQRKAQKQVLKILWGSTNKPGLIPQYLNEQKIVRILGKDGKHQFANIAPTGQAVTQQPQIDPRTQQIQVDAQGKIIMQQVYDLSKFEFDIVISETAETATSRMSNFSDLIQAQQAGIQIPPDILLNFMDFPGKEDVKQRMVESQQQQQQMAAQQMQMQMQIQQAELGIKQQEIAVKKQEADTKRLPPPRVSLSTDITKLPPSVQSQLYMAEGLQVSQNEIAQTMLVQNPQVLQQQQAQQAQQQQSQGTPNLGGQ